MNIRIKLESDNNILNQMDAKTATQILEKQQKSKVEMSLNKRILRSLTIFSSNTSIHGLRFVAHPFDLRCYCHSQACRMHRSIF
jgi:hypothetical protein